jgi:hypothetical protein
MSIEAFDRRASAALQAAVTTCEVVVAALGARGEHDL